MNGRLIDGAALLLLLSVSSLASIPARVQGQVAPAKDPKKKEPEEERCVFDVGGSFRGLYRWALRQELVLRGTPRCEQRLATSQWIVFKAENLADVFATSEPNGAGNTSAGVTLFANQIPGSIPTQAVQWTLCRAADGKAGNEQGGSTPCRSSDDFIGTVRLKGLDGLGTEKDANGQPRLMVSFDESDVDQLHSGKAVDGIAVVTRESIAKGSGPAAANTAALSSHEDGPSGLTTRADEIFKAQVKAQPPTSKLTDAQREPLEDVCRAAEIAPCSQDPTCTKREDCRKGCEDDKQAFENCIHAEHLAQLSPWRVHPLTWLPNVWFREYGENADWYWNSEHARLKEISSISFATTQGYSEPLRVRVDLVVPAKDSAKEVVLYSTEVVLANSARSESLPLPMRERLYVACGEGADSAIPKSRICPATFESGEIDIACNAATRAVDDAAIEGGSCFLHYDPNIGQQPKNGFGLHGPQDVLVTVSRDGATAVSTHWLIEFPSERQHVALPVLVAGSKGTGPYRVRAVLDGAQNSEVVYRPAASSSKASKSDATTSPGALEFAVRLRPRGSTGWRSPSVRTFITFPVQFVGFRIPARPRELHASSESPTVQTTTPRLGVLLAVEPWDYDSGSSPFAIPVRFMTGLNVFDLANGSLAPSFVTGISATFPIIDLPSGTANNQLGTDVAVGAFWEVDLQEQDPFATGNHFLLTIGLNLLSLFGSK